jgi:hypothetical protein
MVIAPMPMVFDFAVFEHDFFGRQIHSAHLAFGHITAGCEIWCCSGRWKVSCVFIVRCLCQRDDPVAIFAAKFRLNRNRQTHQPL